MAADWWMTCNNMKPTKKWVKQVQKGESFMQDKAEITADIKPIIYDFIVEFHGNESQCYDYALELFCQHPVTQNLTKQEYEEARECLLSEIDYMLSGEI